MNICVISGELVNRDNEASISYAPCVVFNPPAELEQLLTTNGKGLAVERQGRVSNSRFDAQSEPRY
mgnify:CR=1 FL=1